MNNRIDKKISKSMGLGLISLGFFFFFLPDFTVLDILPDLIGYILISAGLTKFGDLYEELAESKKMFNRLAILGIAKLISVFIVFGVSDGADRPTTILIAVFVIGVAEIVMSVPAYINLFDGLTYMGTRHDGLAVFKKTNEKRSKKRSYTDRVKRFTLSFIICKNVFMILPEMLAISYTDSVQSNNYSRYDFINHFRVLSMIIIFILGIIWIVKITKYFSALRKDTPFIEKLKEKYTNEILNNETIFIRRRIKTSFFVFGTGAVLALDIYVNGNAGFNLIPDFFSAACFVFAALLIGEKKCIYKIMSVSSGVAYGALSLISYLFNNYFNSDFHPKDVSRKIAAFNRWNIALAISAAEAICFIIMISAVSMLLYQIVKKHCGYIPIHASIDPAAKSQAVYDKMKKYICTAFAFGVLAGFAIFFRVYAFSVEAISEWSWLIELIIEIVFASTFILTLFRINEEVEEKYQFS